MFSEEKRNLDDQAKCDRSYFRIGQSHEEASLGNIERVTLFELKETISTEKFVKFFLKICFFE